MKKITIAMLFVTTMVMSSFAIVNDFNWSSATTITAIQSVTTSDAKSACLIATAAGKIYVFYMSDAAGTQIYELAKQALTTQKSIQVWTSLNQSNLVWVGYIGYTYGGNAYSPCYGISLSK
jgi:hypothetical protein